MDEELERCAHCGAAGWVITNFENGNTGYKVECVECYAGEFITDKEEAIAAWNRRVKEKENGGGP